MDVDLNVLIPSLGVDGKDVPYVDPGDGDWTGKGYATKEDAFMSYEKHAHECGFSVWRVSEKPRKSNPRKNAVLTYCCFKQGFRRGSKLDPKNHKLDANSVDVNKSTSVKRRTPETRVSCNAKVRFHLDEDCRKFDVVHFEDRANSLSRI